jgi:PAS domain S-box-containing protein
VRVHGELLAVVVLIVSKPLEPGTVDAVETLVAQLALALESVTLADDLHVRQSEARFRALVQNSSDAILLLDREASVTYQSPSADRMFGYADGELVGHIVEDLCHPDDLLRVQSGLTDVLSSPGTTRRLELRLRRRGGGWLDAEAAVTNLQGDPNVRATVVTIRDISERKQFEMQLTHQAFHDELTGLANRALFVDRVAHGLARRERDGTGLAVLLLDLDDFKTVNDGLGHAAGDSMLQAVAERLATLVRPVTRPPGSAATSSRWCWSTCRPSSPRCTRSSASSRCSASRCSSRARRSSRTAASASRSPATPPTGRSRPTSCCATPTPRCTS